MKKILLILVAVVGFGIIANAQKNCETKGVNSVPALAKEKTPYSPVVNNAQANCEYKISFTSYDAETGSIYCDVKYTNLAGKEILTNDIETIKPKAGTTIYVRFWNSTLGVVYVEYKICKVNL